MRIGCPKEIKNREYRVGLTPESAGELVANGHEVWMESGAGAGIGAFDSDYTDRGAKVVAGADEVFAECEMIVKVKEPQPEEIARLREGQLLYTYLHLAPDAAQTEGLIKVITARNGLILGAGIVGPHAGELIHPWVLAITEKLKIGTMASFIAPYPTYGEISKRVAGSYYTPSLFSARTRAVVKFLSLFG